MCRGGVENFWFVICSSYRDISRGSLDILIQRHGIEIIVLILIILLAVIPELWEILFGFENDNGGVDTADQEVVNDKMDKEIHVHHGCNRNDMKVGQQKVQEKNKKGERVDQDQEFGVVESEHVFSRQVL